MADFVCIIKQQLEMLRRDDTYLVSVFFKSIKNDSLRICCDLKIKDLSYANKIYNKFHKRLWVLLNSI
jgi:hypothetical protein